MRISTLFRMAYGALWVTLALGMTACVAQAQGARPPANAPAIAPWRQHYRAALDAHTQRDYPKFRDELLKVREVLGGNSGVSYNLACAEALLGHKRAALDYLREYAASGLVANALADSDFVSIWGEPEFQRIALRLKANGRPAAPSTLVHTFGDVGALIEDVCHDSASGTWYASSVRRGLVFTFDTSGVEKRLAVAPEGWGAFAVSVDPARRLLWASVAALPTADGYAEADSGRTALVCWDLAAGKVIRRLETPRTGVRRLLGDMCLTSDGTVYVTDSFAGTVYRVRAGGDSLEVVVADGVLRGPQTPALAADGKRLYVADSGVGISIVDLASGDVKPMRCKPGVCIEGIDGLVRDGAILYAVQNGTRPERVVRFQLDAKGEEVLGWTLYEQGGLSLGEPTHGAIVDGGFVFIANSGWDRVGKDEKLKDTLDARPAQLRRVPLAVQAVGIR
jgi:sugar lactone lactonase YvrE